jgi:hypothetical protein
MPLADTLPFASGAASAGVLTDASRGDHVHPQEPYALVLNNIAHYHSSVSGNYGLSTQRTMRGPVMFVKSGSVNVGFRMGANSSATSGDVRIALFDTTGYERSHLDGYHPGTLLGQEVTPTVVGAQTDDIIMTTTGFTVDAGVLYWLMLHNDTDASLNFRGQLDVLVDTPGNVGNGKSGRWESGVTGARASYDVDVTPPTTAEATAVAWIVSPA